MGNGMPEQNWEEMVAEPIEDGDDVEVVVNITTTVPDNTLVEKTEVKKETEIVEKEA